MDFGISISTSIIFTIYTLTLIQLVFFYRGPTPLPPLLSVLGLVIMAWALGAISYASIPFIVLLYLSAYCTVERERSNLVFSRAAYLSLVIFSFVFALHKVPGFHNELLYSSDSFGQSGLPFQLYANLDKALAAVAVLMAFNQQITWKISRLDGKLIILVLLVFFGLCWLVGAQLDSKFGELTFGFLFFNLFVTCIAEEAFFRLLIQEKLAKYLPSQYSDYLAVFITALIFMLAHFHIGVGAEKRLFLIFFAGLFYGVIYLRSKSLGSAIILHFSVNMIHFSFFTYPATFSEF